MPLPIAGEKGQTDCSCEAAPPAQGHGLHEARTDVQCGCGWGKDSIGTYPNSLQEVKLIMQEDQMCESHLHYYYTNTIQLCMGDPKTKKASFKVRMTVYFAWIWGEVCLQKIWDLGTASPSRHQDTSWG